MKSFKDIIKLYKGFIKNKKIGPSSVPFYEREIAKAERILELIKTGKMTPGEFKKFDSRDRRDISRVLKNVIWCCEECGSEMGKKLPASPFFEGDTVECSECGHTLKTRTPGGQGDDFGFTFKRPRKTKKHGSNTGS